MNDRGRGKGSPDVRSLDLRPLGDQRHDDKLQADEGSGGPAHDQIKAVPFSKLCHADN